MTHYFILLILLVLQSIAFAETLANLSINNNIQTHEKSMIISELEKSIQEIVESVSPGIVSIDIQGIANVPQSTKLDPLFTFFFGNAENIARQYFSVGSGFVISTNGYILSNWHQIKNADQINIILKNGSIHPATMVGADKELNIALLKIEHNDLTPLAIGDSDLIKIGDISLGFGNPFSLSQSLTFGIISSISQKGLLPGLEYFIQSNIPTDNLSSGAPLVNMNGQVVGINTCILNKNFEPSGLSYAIPINVAMNIVQYILDPASEERGFLGIVPQELDKITEEILGLETSGGIVISSVNNNSPAEKSGLKQGDIIKYINTIPITNIATLNTVINSKPANTSIEIEILRGKSQEKIIVTLSERPSPLIRNISTIPEKSTKQIYEFQGVVFENPSSEELKNNGAKSGVIIRKVAADSPFVFILSSGNIITSINNFNIDNMETLIQIIETQKNSMAFSFGIYSHGFFLYRSFKF